MIECATGRSCGEDDSTYYKFLKLEVETLQLKVHRLEQSIEVKNELFGQHLVDLSDWKKESEAKFSAVEQHSRLGQQLAQFDQWKQESQEKLARLDELIAQCNVRVQVQLGTLHAKVTAVSENEKRMQEDANKLHNAVSDLRLAFTAQVVNFDAHASPDPPALQATAQATEQAPKQVVEQVVEPAADKDKTSIDLANFKSEFYVWKQTVTSEMHALRDRISVMPEGHEVNSHNEADMKPARYSHILSQEEAASSYEKALKQIEENFYEFKSSVYDGFILSFSELLYTEDSLAILFGVFSSIIIQLAVLILIAAANLDDPYKWQDFAWRWRLEFAHQSEGWGNLVQMQNVSLARVICDKAPHIPFKSRQRELVHSIQTYTEPFPGIGLEDGLCMMMMMLAVWICAIVEEIRDAIKMTLAVSSIPHTFGDTMKIRQAEEENKFHITAIGTARMIFVTLLCLCRLAIACALCVIGCRWLAQTTDMEDLILDSMALKFIVGIDEMMLEFLGLPEVSWMISNMAPLPAPGCFAPRRRSNHFILPGLGILTGMLLWCVIIFGWVLPYLDSMYSVLDLYCAGSKDFVAWRNETSGLLQVEATNNKVLRPDQGLIDIIQQNIGLNVDS